MNDTRDDQILRLLDTRFDNLPEPGRRDQAASGFVHKAPARVPCEDCLANDRTMYGCETCHGRGYVEEIRERDPYAVEKVQPYGIDVSRLERSRARDAQIARLESQTAPPRSEKDLIEEANHHPYAWELARRRMYADFDYAALDRAIEQLHNFYPDVSPRSPFGLCFLSLRLPNPLRAPAEDSPVANLAARGRHADKGAIAQRNEEVRRSSRAGATVADIELSTGLKKSAIYEILNGTEAAA